MLTIFGCGGSSVTGDNNQGSGPEGRLYVLNQKDTTIYIYDTKTMTRIDSFDSPVPEPHFITFSPNGLHYYIVGRQVGGSLLKFRSSDNTLLQTVPTSIFPTAMVISSDNNTAYVCDFSDVSGKIHRYDVSGDSFIFTDSILQAGYQTHDIDLSPDGTQLISAGFNSDEMTLINTVTDDVLPIHLEDASQIFGAPPASCGPYGVKIDRTGKLGFLACSKGTDQIRIIDLVNKTILDSILVPVSNNPTPARNGPTLMELSLDNNVLFVTNYWDHSLSIVQLSTREVIRKIQFQTPRPFSVKISDDGSRVYVSCTNLFPEKGAVYILDGATYDKLDSVTVGSEPFGIYWQPSP
jgi:DNA-binding beta-propeller fold protein YncE